MSVANPWQVRNNNDEYDDCEYCGNTSGLVDGRGKCITCGAALPKTEKPRIDWGDARRDWSTT